MRRNNEGEQNLLIGQREFGLAIWRERPRVISLWFSLLPSNLILTPAGEQAAENIVDGYAKRSPKHKRVVFNSREYPHWREDNVFLYCLEDDQDELVEQLSLLVADPAMTCKWSSV